MVDCYLMVTVLTKAETNNYKKKAQPKFNNGDLHFEGFSLIHLWMAPFHSFIHYIQLQHFGSIL